MEEWSETELLAHERELLGFYLTSHPLSRYAQDLRFFTQPLSEIDNRRDGETVRVGGLVNRVSTSTDRRGQPIAFITLEDLSGSADVVFFSHACAQNRHLIEPDQAILIEGRLSRRNGSMGLQAESALPLSEAREKLTKALHVSLPLETIEAAILERLRCLCVEHSGKCEFLIHLRNGGDRDAVVRSRSIHVNPCDELLAEVDRLIEPERSWLTAKSPVPLATRN